jgi:hypothetical protein
MRRAIVSQCVACTIGMVVLAGCSRSTSSEGSATPVPDSTAAPAAGAETAARASQPSTNPPWYPSLAAFEHHDSARTHLFVEATFGGDFAGKNTVGSVQSPSASYPSGWNVTYLDADNVFLYGGGAGNEASTIGSYVAKVDAATLAPIWSRQLIDTQQNGEWDYPGTIAILDDGMLYVIYGYHLSKLDPKTGEVVATVTLPTGDAAPANTSYNGFSASADGVIVGKSIYRQAGCTMQGPAALLRCPDPSAVPSSVLVTVDPKTMTVLNTVTLPGEVIGRATVGRYQGKEYVYLFAQSGFIRYAIGPNGALTLDPSWTTGPLLTAGQTLGWATVVMGDWVLGQCNGVPASAPASVYAVNQADASKRFTVQPFANDPIPPAVKAAFRKQGPGGTPAVSWIPSTLSADPDTNLIYMLDALPGKIAALRLTPSGLETAWQVSQTTTEFIAIIGPQDRRAIVATSIPGAEIPGINKHDEVVWRNAATGEELARSARLPAMTPATMVQPSYAGNVLYPGLQGTLFKLLPAPQSR